MKPELRNTTDQMKSNILFTVNSFSAPAFQIPRHNHKEYELILITQGSGLVCIGDYQGTFESGDIYFLSSHLPHVFKGSSKTPISTIAIHFQKNFMNSHECKSILDLLIKADMGLNVTGKSKHSLKILIKRLETDTELKQIITFLQCLEIISTTKEFTILTKNKFQEISTKDNVAIEKVIEFTKTSFYERLSLPQAASIACMSIPSFCNYFKQYTGKTFINYLNQVRSTHACKQLLESNKSITEICYESGYNTVVHFHRQFLRLMNITPLQYRKSFQINQTHINI